MRRLPIALLLAAVLSCGGGGSDDEYEFESDHSSDDGTGSSGGTTVVVVKTLRTESSEALRFRLFPDAVLAVPGESAAADLDLDGRKDAVWVEEGIVRIALARAPAPMSLPSTQPATDVRVLDADGDGPDDLVVLRADGRLDLYVGES